MTSSTGLNHSDLNSPGLNPSRSQPSRLDPPSPHATPRTFNRPLPPSLSGETLALLASIFFALTCNQGFWAAVLAGQSAASRGTWVFALAMLVALVGIHFLLVAPFITHWTAKPLLSILLVATACATYYMDSFSIYLDPGMLRNFFATELKESRDLLVWHMALHVAFYAGLPIALLWAVRLKRRPAARAFGIRAASLLGALAMTGGAIALVYQDLSSLMRNQKEVRYLITPANFLYSSVRALASGQHAVAQARMEVGGDARLADAWRGRKKPVLFVMVVGETARAASWGLSGYERQTTPQLERLNVVNFSNVSSCGTDTETSVPCMFAAVGRRDYDEDRIRHSDSLLQVLQRAGFQVIWRDNSTGCKGVCAGLPEERVDRHPIPELCEEDVCLDEVLVRGMDGVLKDRKGNLFVVLHQMGSHGPAYFNRYPPAFRRFTPTCDTADLRACSRQEIVNTYDNSLLYTDHFLARAVALLASKQAEYATALLYVSDHGESLGESGLYLHGIPYAIAPKVQKEVPMVMWFSPEFLTSFHLDERCLRQQAGRPASHDNVFHSVLGMLEVEASAREPSLDLSRPCRTR